MTEFLVNSFLDSLRVAAASEFRCNGPMDTLGQRIRAIRKAQRIPAKALAEAVGLTQSAISEIEQDRVKSTRVLHRIAQHLGVSAEWLDTGTGSKYSVRDDAGAYNVKTRPMFQVMADAVRVLQEYLEIRDEPRELVADPYLLQLAYQVVEDHGKPVESIDLSALTKQLAKLRRESE